jgi:hypothetical protein
MAVIKQLEHCPIGHLVKMNLVGNAHFALLGQRGNAFTPAYALLGDKCELVNLSDQWGFAPEYDGAFVLDFGSDFIIKPSYADCDIGKGDLFTTAGALVRTSDADYLVGTAPGLRDPAYHNLKTGERRGTPGGGRAAFAAWELYIPDDDKTPLLKMKVR